MNRITAEEVLEAYRETGHKPAQGKYCERLLLEGVQAVCSMCAMSVLAVHRKALHWHDIASSRAPMFLLCHALDLKLDYADGFANGFDEHDCRGTNELYKLGMKDGRKVRDAVFEKVAA